VRCLLGFDCESDRWMVGIGGAGSKKINQSNLVFDDACEYEDGSEEAFGGVSGRSGRDIFQDTGSSAAPACL